MSGFRSRLGAQLLAFLDLKRAMGRQYLANEAELRHFDEYVASAHPHAIRVTREVAHGWLVGKPALGPRSNARRVSILRQFCLYLARIDADSYVPDRELLPATLPVRRAFIYTEEDVRALVAAAQAPRRYGGAFRPATLSTMVLVLYATGLRRGEVCRLRLGDVDLVAQTILVHRTKFFESRLIPFSPSLAEVLQEYLVARRRQPPLEPHAPLFFSRLRRAFRPNKLSSLFHDLVREAGIEAKPDRRPPCLHDMRHTFAVHRLQQWYEEGVDVEAMLSVLATFMGHDNPLSTQVYLHSTMELRREAIHRFQRAYGEHMSVGGGHEDEA